MDVVFFCDEGVMWNFKQYCLIRCHGIVDWFQNVSLCLC